MDLDLQIIYECIALNKMSIRETSCECGLPKSTVHRLIHTKIKDNFRLEYEEVVEVLRYNKEHRCGRKKKIVNG